MTIPAIEDIMVPHLSNLRSLAEAKYGDKVHSVTIEFRDDPERHRIVACVRLTAAHSYKHGFAETVEHAIAEVVATVTPLPNVAAILGLNPDGTVPQ